MPAGFVADNTDCNDTEAAINPNAQEVCDDADVDEDCDGDSDDADTSVDPAGFSTFYADVDQDTFGDPNSTTATCDAPSGFVADNTDCNDDAAAINPNATEVCDDGNVDENCNGDADDADAGVDQSTFSTFYADADADTFGDPLTTNQSCDPTTGFVADDTDCNDAVAAINPGAQEVCDDADVDEDCDGFADDADTHRRSRWLLHVLLGHRQRHLRRCSEPRRRLRPDGRVGGQRYGLQRCGRGDQSRRRRGVRRRERRRKLQRLGRR